MKSIDCVILVCVLPPNLNNCIEYWCHMKGEDLNYLKGLLKILVCLNQVSLCSLISLYYSKCNSLSASG